MMAHDFKRESPTVGEHILVTGIYVIDIREGGHAEPHPIYQIEKLHQ
jgi:hypothetical protein